MDIVGEGNLPAAPVEQSVPGQNSNLNISDVFEAISIADPFYGPGIDEEAMYQPEPPPAEARPYVRIVEQPAGKALRFRYECEGRSAGSIPGANSTPEKKTFPAIEIVGHKGRAIVVVSCVTKDEPYRSHPHNLVGRDLCKKGVCTVNVSPDSPIVTFSNLGIQCVKRRDIEEALRLREEMRVDPFKKGFAHKNQPQSIDLNAVRLCFQVFLPDEKTTKIRHALPPVVSDVIYDKKAMSDLQITRISHCSGPVTGGKAVILLCEKVAREDIAVTFFTRDGDRISWQADAVDIYVHKQVAICFTTPRYHDINTTDHVKAFVQLRRPTDNATSEPLQFELIPSSAGTNRKRPADLAFLHTLLSERPVDPNNNKDNHVSSTSESELVSEDSGSANIAESLSNGDGDTLVVDDVANEKSLNELLDQVAELDEIYSENRTRLENVALRGNDEPDVEEFNDAGTYTSLQLAFRNPVDIAEPDYSYEDVQVQTYRGPIIEFTPLKRETDDERAPPLPPKRVRKAPSVEGFKTSQSSVNSLLKPGRQLPLTRNQDVVINRDRTELSVARSEPALPPAPKKRSFLSRLFRRRDKSPAPSVKSEGKKDKKSKPVGRSVSSVSGLRPSKFKSSVSHASLKDNASGTGLSYADSITHISLHGDENEKSTSQNSLRRPASLAPLPPTDGDTILVAESVLALNATEFKKLQDDLDLTDAEHYALYMAVAPHATASEFDETSCYYAPVDGSKFHTNYYKRKRLKTPSDLSHLLQPADRDINPPAQDIYNELMALQRGKIKLEPRERTPPHQVQSPPLQYHSPHYDRENAPEQYQWDMAVDGMARALVGMPPATHPTHPTHSTHPTHPTHPTHGSYQPQMTDLTWQQLPTNNIAQMSPSHMAPSVSPNHLTQDMAMGHNHMANHMAMSPNHMAMSPNHMAMSPNHMAMSPNHMAMSPNHMAMSPNHMEQAVSPNHMLSPLHQMPVSPNMGHVSPNLVQQQSMAQQQVPQTLMETGGTSESLTGLLAGADGAMLNSAELSGLSGLLAEAERGPEGLSDSLNRLSTGDLLKQL